MGDAPSLLPAGLEDQLPPWAEAEAEALSLILGAARSFGYDRVKPPLLEYEDTLTAFAPDALRKGFKLADPQAEGLLILRSDKTGQVVRIAQTRLKDEPRPLRLSYGGQVLRAKGSQLRPERQFTQAGVELIGVPEGAETRALVEIADLCLTALGTIGVEDITLDLTLPHLAREAAGGDSALIRALSERNATLAGDAGAAGEQVAALIGAFGPWDTAIEALAAAGPSPQMAAAAGVRAVAEAMQDRHPKAEILLDPAELRGFDYHSGLSFVLYAKGIRGELGRGGLYPAGEEQAAGFTLYMDTILRALPAPTRPEKVRVTADADAVEVARRRAAGEVIVADLD
ncbi:MAG: ATP phosphoribosyltransferase regulatory subunit [Alphaproteobacteria bacterium]